MVRGIEGGSSNTASQALGIGLEALEKRKQSAMVTDLKKIGKIDEGDNEGGEDVVGVHGG
jgi:hypothetical protein